MTNRLNSIRERGNGSAVFSIRSRDILKRIAAEGQARGALFTDAALAALAIEYGATLCTADRGFARFAGLRFINPLAE
jgi:predicted nucleic acid-binding protein